jgi:glycosyltransferase involved in cell wall biosynthesis
MKIHYLSKKIAWFGKYSGYECLPNYLPPNQDVKLFIAAPKFFNKVMGKIYQYLNNWKDKRPDQIWAEINFLSQKNASQISHILYLDSHTNVLTKIKTVDNRLTGTIHLPFNHWPEQQLQLLSKLKNIIILYTEEIEKFKRYTPDCRFHYIRHGVDLEFFKPSPQTEVKRKKILFVGHYLRNFEMFFHVYQGIKGTSADKFEYHLIMPTINRNSEWVKRIANNADVFFHEKLSDEELLAHYHDSYVMLMPMDDSGANTAIIQALAVGLPIITTDVGGIRCYGGGDVYPLVANNHNDEMIELFFKYYNDQAFRDNIAIKQRKFAEDFLDWNIIAQEHIDVYKTFGA